MLKTKTKVRIAFVGILSIAAGVQASSLVVNQTEATDCSITSGNTSCDASTTFQVNVVESLTVTVTTPAESASGSMNTFLRNKVNLTVTSNNSSGFYASIYAPNDAGLNLTNSTPGNSETIAPVTANTTRGNFAANQINHWGYSLDDIDAGSASSNYSAISTTPARVLYNNGVATESKDIYFGMQTNAAKVSGTYTGTVVVGVITGSIGESPAAPTDPAQNGDTSDGVATYDNTNDRNRTVYYETSGNSTTATVSSGNNTGVYADPAGVTEHTTSSIAEGTSLATGLLVASAVAATSGLFFIVLAKRNKDDDEEDEENMV